VGLTLVWHFTPLAELTDPANIEAAMTSVSENPWSAAIVLAAFVGGGLVAFPVNLLIAATAAAFGPLIGFAYAAAGTLVSALVTYGLGAWRGATEHHGAEAKPHSQGHRAERYSLSGGDTTSAAGALYPRQHGSGRQ
jgi:uncharacterized membrane protein YdjX (TVP38/TMEM64 family)